MATKSRPKLDPNDSFDNGPGDIQPIQFAEEIGQSFLDYAMSVLTDRALPDVRDGLKPVHRRILWSMHKDGINPSKPHKKSATVVGGVIGNYHPHGDSACYEALVRLTQKFSLSVPLIDGHGNFGTPDDGAASSRYCVTGETFIRLADGSLRRIDSLIPDAVPNTDHIVDFKVLDGQGSPVTAERFFHSGVHPIVKLTTRKGFELRGTGNHLVRVATTSANRPVLAWKTLDELQVGDRVAVSRATPHVPLTDTTDRTYRLGLLLGAMVAEGWYTTKRAGFNNTDKAYFDAVLEGWREFAPNVKFYVGQTVLKSGKPVYSIDCQRTETLEDTPLSCLNGLRSGEQQVPESVLTGSPLMQLGFLRGLFEGDGSVSPKTAAINYTSKSSRLLHGVAQLLLNFGVVAKYEIDSTKNTSQLHIGGQGNVNAFIQNVGMPFAKHAACLATFKPAWSVKAAAADLDTIPNLSVFVRANRIDSRRLSYPPGEKRGGKASKWITRTRIDTPAAWERYGQKVLNCLTPTAARIADEYVQSVKPLFFDEVTSVAPDGNEAVYSLRLTSDERAFVTNGFVSHNTECRLAPSALTLLSDIDEDTVDMVPNFSGETMEPAVLPARFPNLLVNGVQGIAVGMATNIPPHNLGEVVDAVVHLIRNPESSVDDLLKHIKGPDFPSGGLILGSEGIKDMARTGRGTMKVRALCEVEETRNGNRIVVSEIPYQASVTGIAGRIAELVNEGTLDGIRNVNDESSKGLTKLVIDLKKDANPWVVLNNLYKYTALQTSFSGNMIALVDGTPVQITYLSALQSYLTHQRDVIRRRTEFRLAKAVSRAHILEGLLKALQIIDAVVAVIRESDSRDVALASLVSVEPINVERVENRKLVSGAVVFGFSDAQANYLLDMTLSRLTKTNQHDAETELDLKRTEIGTFKSILESVSVLDEVIVSELTVTRKLLAGPRRSPIVADPGSIVVEDLIEDVPVVVTMTGVGYIKSTPLDAFHSQGRGGRGVIGAKVKQGDLVASMVTTTAHSWLLFFTNRGKVYRIKAHEIPQMDRSARGQHIANVLPLTPGETVQVIIDTHPGKDGPPPTYLFFVTKGGHVKKTDFTAYDNVNRNGLIALNLRDGDELVRVIPTTEKNDILLVSHAGQAIRFHDSDVRPMGRQAAGVRGMKLRAGDFVVAAESTPPGVPEDELTETPTQGSDGDLFVMTSAGYGKRVDINRFGAQTRGGIGVRCVKLSAKKGTVVAAFKTDATTGDVIVTSSSGVTMRTPIGSISRQGREATGVSVMKLGSDNEEVVSVVPIFVEDTPET